MTITKERPQELLERPPKDVSERPKLRRPEVQRPRGRRWYPWIASLVVVGIAATALVVYLVGGREGTVTYETSFNYELAEMIAVEPALAGPINTIGATYDPLVGTVVFPNAARAITMLEAPAFELLPGYFVDSTVGYYSPAAGTWVPPIPETAEPINTLGATYDPAVGTVVYPNAG